MKCNKCGKEQSDKAVVCPYCGFRLPKEIAKEAAAERSTLIEFPSASNRSDRSLRNNASNGVSSNSDWRAELSAKVRQVKERRNMQEARGRLQAELEAAAHRYQQANTQNPSGTTVATSTLTGAGNNLDLEVDRPSNPVIEAALKRVQRASEIAVKKQPFNNIATVIPNSASQTVVQSLPQVPSIAKSSSMAIELQEDGLNSLTTTTISSTVDLITSDTILSNIENEPIAISKIERESVSVVTTASGRIISAIPKTLSMPTVGATAVAPLVIEEEEIVEKQHIVPLIEEVAIAQNNREFSFLMGMADLEAEIEEPKRAVRVIKESEVGPNYLDELIAVCEQNRSLSSDAANHSQRLIAATLDLFIIATLSAVFYGTSYALGVNFSDERVVIALGAASVFIGLVYLTMMVFVTARTFGMMFVGTRVINSNTKESPSILQAFLRAIGYFVSIGLLGLGFIWMFLDHDRRTFHDIISSTFVVRDY